jgi:transketolase
MYGHDLSAYADRVAAFGWHPVVVEDGHDLDQVLAAYDTALAVTGKPAMIIARTLKGAGVPAIANKDGWHGKPLPKDMLDTALAEVGEVDENLTGSFAKPEVQAPEATKSIPAPGMDYEPDAKVAPRKAYGQALARLALAHPDMVVLDAEVSNSTHAEEFKKVAPERFFEMYIAEQNMAGAALGFALRGKRPFVSTFAAFMSRAYDQIRMSQYSLTDQGIVFCGSHAGVSIGEDGASQMAIEDLAFFRTILGSAVVYPADAVSCQRLVEETLGRSGVTYIRTTRAALPLLYASHERFPIGGSKVVRESGADAVTLVGAGITVHEALAAADMLAKEGIQARVIDCYSVKPIDAATLARAADETRAVIVIEDHAAEGGLGEAVAGALAGKAARFRSLAVRKMPRSGKPDELLAFEDISRHAIVRVVKEVL